MTYSIIGILPTIVLLTSFNWDEIADEAKGAGVDSFVSKPLFAGTVLEEFREAFKRKNEAIIARTAISKENASCWRKMWPSMPRS